MAYTKGNTASVLFCLCTRYTTVLEPFGQSMLEPETLFIKHGELLKVSEQRFPMRGFMVRSGGCEWRVLIRVLILSLLCWRYRILWGRKHEKMSRFVRSVQWSRKSSIWQLRWIFSCSQVSLWVFEGRRYFWSGVWKFTKHTTTTGAAALVSPLSPNHWTTWTSYSCYCCCFFHSFHSWTGFWKKKKYCEPQNASKI